MTKKNIKNIIIGVLLFVAVFGAGLYANIIKLPITREIHSQWIAELDSDEGIIGASHNVFAGKVKRKAGSRSIYEIPETQFEVEVIYNIKGDLRGTAIVSQEGGYKNGILYRSFGDVMTASDESDKQNDDGLMKQGETYLFVARYSEKGNWYSIISHPKGTKLLSKDKNLSKADFQYLYENDERVIKLKEAYKNEILLDSDVKEGNARNSYQSLQEKE